MTQFPPEDSLRDVWVKEDSKWIVASVRGSHTISTHIGIDSLADAWQRDGALDATRLTRVYWFHQAIQQFTELR